MPQQPKRLTAGDLIKLLKTVPKDTLVILSHDEEGNRYSPLYEVSGGVRFPNEDWYYTDSLLYPQDVDAGELSQEDFDKAAPAIILWPMV